MHVHFFLLLSSAWKIPWMEEPGGLQSMGSPRVRHDWATSLSLFTFMHWKRKWQIPGTGEPGGLPSMGSHRVGHDWNDLADLAECDIISNIHLVFVSYSFQRLSLKPLESLEWWNVFGTLMRYPDSFKMWAACQINKNRITGLEHSALPQEGKGAWAQITNFQWFTQ